MYIEKANPVLQECAKKMGREFIVQYETDSNFREFCDLISVASPEKVEQVRQILIKEL